MGVSALICVGDTPGGRSGRLVGECLLWSRDRPVCSCAIRQMAPRWSPWSRVVIDLGEPAGGAGFLAADFDPQILILTHSDRDHIGGTVSFFHMDPRSLQEVWVPYEWGILAMALTQARSHRQTSPNDAVSDSVERIRRVGADRLGEILLPAATRTDDALDDRMFDVESATAFNPEVWVDLADRPDLREWLVFEIVDVIEQERVQNTAWPPLPRPGNAVGVAKDVVRKCTKILDVLASSLRQGARLRFFSTDGVHEDPPPWLHTGQPGLATVVNAVEVRLAFHHFREPALAAYMLSRLTDQNRRALMTFLWDRPAVDSLLLDTSQPEHACWWDRTDRTLHHCGRWGVLVCSDSTGESACVQRDPAQSLIPWDRIAAMTAPHHGSTNVGHQDLWRLRSLVATAQGREVPVVAAGGGPLRWGTTSEYTGLDRTFRACTRCRHTRSWDHRTVSLLVDGSQVSVTPNCDW